MPETTSRQDLGLTTAAARFHNRVQAWQPMLAVRGPFPAPHLRNSYAYETTTLGQRVLAHITARGRAHLISSTGDDITATYPELSYLPQLTHVGEAVFDAEIVTTDLPSCPSPHLLRTMAHRARHQAAAARAARTPHPQPHLVISDVLYAGRPVLRLPYIQRRLLLRHLLLPVADPRITASRRWPHAVAHQLAGSDLRPHGYAGILAKHLASPYRPSCRSTSWLTTVPA